MCFDSGGTTRTRQVRRASPSKDAIYIKYIKTECPQNSVEARILPLERSSVMIYISTASNTTIYREAPQPNDRTVLAASKSPRLGQMLVFSLFPLFWPSFRRKVHVYAADANSPTMDTSDAVGWFIVDMRDLAGQRQQERWVKLQGASPAEVLISSSLAMARDRGDLPKQLARDATNPAPSSLSAKAVSDTTEGEGEHHCPPTATADTTPTTTCLLYTSPSPRDRQKSRMPSSA